jgi:hypothetical protein
VKGWERIGVDCVSGTTKHRKLHFSPITRFEHLFFASNPSIFGREKDNGRERERTLFHQPHRARSCPRLGVLFLLLDVVFLLEVDERGESDCAGAGGGSLGVSVPAPTVVHGEDEVWAGRKSEK